MIARLVRLCALCAACGCLAACAVGPDFRRPEPPAESGYATEPLAAQTVSAPVAGGAEQRFVFGRDIPAQWWQIYRSAALDRMIRAALADSPTLEAAQAALRASQENLIAATAVLYPSVDAKLSASRQKITGAPQNQPLARIPAFNLYNASVNVSYQIDVAGGARRELESLEAQVDYQRYQIAATYLTLTSNIVTTAVSEASLRAQIGATRDIIDAQQRSLAVVEKQLALGAVSSAEVLAQRAQLAQSRATLPPLEKALAQTRNALAMLVGKTPATAELPQFELAALELPRELPVSLPSALVRQRPDIQAAEALLHQASAQIGVATAAEYPQLTLSGAYGSTATSTGSLFGPSSMAWNVGAGLLQPIFHGGALKAQERAAVAAYDRALAQYRQTVLGAFQNVADALRALDSDAQALKAQAEAESAARDSYQLARSQFELGATSYLVLLNAEQQYQRSRIGLVQAQAARYADTAALLQALGGGWWHDASALVPESDTAGSRNR
jgi:NodT family efflux transporter outer membrane factor (OMF) lipoprotein